MPRRVSELDEDRSRTSLKSLHEMIVQIARTVVEPGRDSMAECGHPHLGR